MRQFILLPFIALLLLPGTSVHAQVYNGPAAEIDQILENIKAFSRHCVAGDAASIANAYTKDGKIFPAGRDIMEGRQALEQYWTPRPGNETTYHKITPLEITVIGDTAHDHGYYEGRSRQSDGEESSWRGKYLIVWKKVDGTWKIYLDIWNRM